MADRKPKDPFAEFKDAPSDDPFAEFQDAPAEAAPVSEIPRRRGPSLASIGGRETGFRQQVEATGMTPEQRQAAVAGMIPVAASLAAGPVVGGTVRAVAPFLGRAAPVVEQFGRSVQSGGLAPKLSKTQTLLGAGTAGGVSTAVVNPEDASTGAVIGMMTPTAARVVRPFMRPSGPATKEVTKAADAEYTAMRSLNEQLSPQQFKELQTSLTDMAKQSQYLADKHDKIAKAFNIFKSQAKYNEPVSIDRVDKLRKELAKAANSADFEERDIAKNLVAQLDSFVANAAPESAAHLAAGRELVVNKSRSKIIDNILDKAKRSKNEPTETIRNEFVKLARGEGKYAAKKRQFSAEQQDIIQDIADGRASINALETIGQMFAPPRVIRPSQDEVLRGLQRMGLVGGSATGLGLTQAVSYPLAVGLGVTTAGIGAGSRAAANRLAMMEADRLRALAASGGVLQLRARPDLFPQFVPAAVGNAFAPEQVNFLAEQQRLAEQGF
ncbi:MAG: hypothetical protein EBV32_02815 [Proteobacteria bacterium]|uniref:Uncharacterized protein n=1 Tax=Candidatus Fonsibacter lacus TaxID=2576439 RepID=A0A964XRW6_9PROT|nr:hypothetical protein [Candidatus Fonsibacter lacus]